MNREEICAVVMAGGQSRRMGGGDKCLRELGGRTILARILERLRPQVGAIVLNANGDPERFSAYGLPVTADSIEDFAGPLAGVLSGLDWAAANRPDCRWVLSVPGDAPFLPTDLAGRLLAAVEREGADMACASSNGRSHPVVGLWPLALREELRRALEEEGVRKVDLWTARYRLAQVDFPLRQAPSGPLDPFFNTNRPDDLAAAEAFLKQEG